jgi:hypothetical protein
MSALGQKQTFAVQKGMSALLPIADIDLTARRGAKEVSQNAATGLAKDQARRSGTAQSR